ncbi:MAG: grasp-with-spasm system ATP-grasp peptide maturase [Bacteroidia bacterium]|nr:grasp-with-spasm system ATP-grasp peptide maturase [Bacteroidia bacterium]
MIILYSLHNDTSTQEVIKWLESFKKEYILITDLSDISIHSKLINTSFIGKKIESIWYRQHNSKEFDLSLYSPTNAFFISREYESYLYHLQYLFKSNNIKSLGNGFDKMNLNKSEVLFLAKSIGLTIPETLVTTLKDELKNFFLLHDKIITKPIFNGIVVDYDDESYGTMYTALVEEELIKQLPSVFFPSLFQEYINKDIELRIFYLDGQFYSTAIFTQIKSSIIDSRNLEVVENCRSIPYNLPEEIEAKIILLMKSLLLNTGSIDMIKSDSGQYYFLEVNPIGIFDGISLDCNYYLNKKVAEWLAK